jgi:hypothetical protein
MNCNKNYHHIAKTFCLALLSVNECIQIAFVTANFQELGTVVVQVVFIKYFFFLQATYP